MAIILISQGFVGVNLQRNPSVYRRFRIFAGPTKYMPDQGSGANRGRHQPMAELELAAASPACCSLLER
jgi:hypothetical protein